MAIMPPMHGPKAALKDLVAFLRQRDREKTIGGILAVLSTVVIILMFLIDPKVNTAPDATLTYIESWPEDRTDAEIVAQQEIDQAAKDKAIEERRKAFEDLEEFNNSIGLE